MPSPRIARSILILLALEVGICTAFLADQWPPLQQRENSLAHFFLGATRDDRAFVLDDSPGDKRIRLVRPLEEGTPKAYLRVDIIEEPEQIFEESPPSATDWAVILNNARKLGSSIAAIDHPLTWEDAGEIPLRALDHELSSFDHAVLCVDLRRDAEARAQPIPPYLSRSSVPLGNLLGNPGDLPRANRVALPTAAIGDDSTIFAFRFLENEVAATPDQPPLLPRTFVLWGDRLVPSFPVALAMAQYGVSPEDVRIELGRHVRLGNGPIIPIDDFGQLALPLTAHPKTPFTTAESLIEPGFASRMLQQGAPDCTLFVDATGTSPSPWHSPAHLLRIVASLDLLEHPGPAESHPRLPLWGELLLFLLVGILAAIFLRFSPFNRALSFGLVLLGCLMLLAGLVDLTPSHTWTPLAPVLATALTAWFFSSRLARHLPVEQGANAER